jgi:hypothetical protein
VLQTKPATKNKAKIVNPVNISVSFTIPKVMKYVGANSTYFL